MVFSFHVYRKSSPNGKLSVYIGHRDFIDHLTHVDPVDGVVVLDKDYVRDRKVYGQVVVTYRYGREEDEVMGLTFAKELVVAAFQVYPQISNPRLTPLQDRLMKKLGPNCFPFHFDLPQDAPSSVTLQQAREDEGKPCGVQWELRVFVGDHCDDQPHRRSCVKLGIRRLQYAPAKQGKQPVASGAKEFLLSPGKLHMQVTLDKQIYYHGDAVRVTVTIRNHSNKQVKKLRVAIVQLCDVSLGPSGQFKNVVANLDTQEGCPVVPNASLNRTFTLTPVLDHNRNKRGVALDGQLKLEDTNLASSTLFTNPEQREVFGIVVSYVARVKVILGTLGGDLVTEVPFTLMNPPPEAHLSVKDGRSSSIDENTRLVIEECRRLSTGDILPSQQSTDSIDPPLKSPEPSASTQ
ncbi:arrestin homolog [Oratosquilla oratoria]|uniref:arrestin homolog n=1 Tax=Oratosquilla oratoria TaxID=337810 RepID=UPI003F7646A9